MRFQEKVALISGGGTGLGRAIALELAREGANLALVGRRREPLEEVKKEAEQLGVKVLVVPADLTVEEQVQKMVATTIDAFERVDVLVNGAGTINSTADVEGCTLEDWNAMIASNLTTAFLASKFVVPELVKTKGNIVNLASLSSLVGMYNLSGYSSAKGGLAMLTRGMAIDYGPKGVRINAVCPGVIETELSKGILERIKNAGRYETFLAKHPLGTIPEPIDVARAVAFLASNDARFITGVLLRIDAGLLA